MLKIALLIRLICRLQINLSQKKLPKNSFRATRLVTFSTILKYLNKFSFDKYCIYNPQLSLIHCTFINWYQLSEKNWFKNTPYRVEGYHSFFMWIVKWGKQLTSPKVSLGIFYSLTNKTIPGKKVFLFK